MEIYGYELNINSTENLSSEEAAVIKKQMVNLVRGLRANDLDKKIIEIQINRMDEISEATKKIAAEELAEFKKYSLQDLEGEDFSSILEKIKQAFDRINKRLTKLQLQRLSEENFNNLFRQYLSNN